jgi:heme-degrading monooxygenase HmoA
MYLDSDYNLLTGYVKEGGGDMIVRLWRGRVPTEMAAEYRTYQEDVGPSGYTRIPGNRGVYMLGRDLGDEYEIAMLTLWESWNAIRVFAGDPIDDAKYYERDFEFLVDPPEKVEHFEVLLAATVSERE